jgi:bifunctional DNA-binding transcriptional regulator/antitoxin component of YhaV-PrlF toxin-antitoxin module
MIAKISRKNQVTLPKKIVEKLGFFPSEEKYVDFEVHGNTVLMKPVTVTVEEKLSNEQLERFRDWALDHDRDIALDSAEEATEFLKKRMKKG